MRYKAMKLIQPTIEHETILKSYVDEMLKNNDSCHGCGSIEKYERYEDWLKHIESYAVKALIPKDSKYVEGSQYFLYDETNQNVVGMVNIRHELNAYLMKFGGHIGYSIRPSYRQKGYAKLQLNLALDILRKKGVDKALITCNSDNIASMKTILACGGVEDTPSIEDDGTIIKRFWIPL